MQTPVEAMASKPSELARELLELESETFELTDFADASEAMLGSCSCSCSSCCSSCSTSSCSSTCSSCCSL
jgi:hypothetical protein